MAQVNQGSAGVTATEIDFSGPLTQTPTGVPAGVIGTALKGPAFVPVTVGTISDFYAKFGTTDGKKFGPLAVAEWMRNANAVTYLRVLGAGEGGARDVDGSVARAGFAVGAELPDSDGVITSNSFANAGGPDGRTYFLGAFMSESLGSSVFSSAGLQGVGGVTPNPQSAVPIIRGVVMAPSGVILRLSASFDTTNTSDAPASSYVADDATAQGNIVGDVRLEEGGLAKQEFVMILNGHIGADVNYSNVITASFDPTAGNYFANIFNKDPYKIQDAGHFLYANWDIHPSTAAVTGTVLVGSAYGADLQNGLEPSAFLTTSSLTYNSGSTEVPNYEGFEDRFGHARSPWVISQRFGGSPANLFKLHAIDAGAGVSNLYKISIENITPSPDATNKFGSFDIIVRDWRDRDGALQPLEKFRGVNLDPRSDRYIAKVIGDAHVFFDFDRDIGAQAVVVEGNYPARSNYIRVEVDSGVETGTVDPTALPLGFRGIAHLVTSGSMPLASNDCDSTLSSADLVKRAVTPPLPMRSNITRGSGGRVQASPSFFWGTQFEHVVTLTDTNSSTLKNDSLNSFVKYFPDYSTQYANFVAGDNTGAVDTAALGIIDADRFCNNLFTLENVQVVTGSNTLADVNKWANATYVRRGNIVADAAAKTRALKVDDLTLRVNRRLAKFTFPLQGGFDGVNLFNRETAELTNNAVTADMDNTARGLQDGATVKAYTKALEIMKNTVNTDIQLLAIPGIRHESVTDRAADAVRDRFDALYIMDVRQYDDNVTEVTSSAQTPSVTYTAQEFSSRTLDNSFAAAYFPDVVLQDPTTRESLVVPPSVAVLGALALNDRVGYPWFAPAGTTRGALPTVTRANVPLSKLNMDTLYDVNINPLVALQPDSGVVVWGQKTLQAAASALDRVNVRRLLIEIRRQVRDIAQTILFEPNRAATLARFTAAVTPRLQRIQALAGLDRFKVIIDSSTTTQADVENNTVRGKIFVQPTRSIEFVSLDFVVTNNIAE